MDDIGHQSYNIDKVAKYSFIFLRHFQIIANN